MRAVVALWSALVLATATVPLAAGYRSGWVLPVLGLLVVLPAGLVALGRALRLPAWAIASAGVTLGLLPALMVADTADPAQDADRPVPALSLLAPLVDAVPRLLTAPRPAPADPAFLVPAALLVYLTALVVALLVVGRRRTGAAPLVGAVVLHTAGAALTAGQSDPLGLAALMTALVLVLGWVWLPGPRAADPGPGAEPASAAEPGAAAPVRRSAVLPSVTAVVAASFALTATLVPTDDAFDPRALVPPPALPAAATNPLPDLAAWSARADRTLFTVRSVDSGPVPSRLMLTALPDFDGATWRIGARLRAVGVVDEPDLPPGELRREVSYVVYPDQLDGLWLPAAGRAQEVDAEVLAEVHTGALVVPAGLDGQPVSVRTELDVAAPAALMRAGVPPPSTAGRYLDVPRLPEELRHLATETVDGLGSRWEQALALQEVVRGERLLDHQAPSGSSYGRLQEFLFLDPEDGGQVGSTEQFAAAFAVLGRAAGLPTRVVVGFDLGDEAEAGAEMVTVRGEHARAWAEVYFARVGWVPFDPSPDVTTEVDRPEEVPEPDPAQADPTAPDEPEPTAQDEADAAVPQPRSEPPSRSWSGVVAGTLGTLVALLALAVVAASAVVARRRRRWRRSGPVGSWALVQRSLRVAGRPVPAHQSAPALAASVAEPVRQAAGVVAGQAERAAFAPPAADTTHTSDEATDSWALATEVERYLRRQVPWWRRLAWWVWPR